MKHINNNLISIKCVLFLFFGGISCIFPFLLNHMTSKGLTYDESWIISTVAPCVALFGPAIAGPLADRLAGGFGGNKRSKTGRYLRVMIAVCMILAAIFYCLLMAVPTVIKTPPDVIFMCDQHGGMIMQQRCGAEKTCYNWNHEERGSLRVTNCRFTCESTLELSSPDLTTIYPDQEASAASEEYDTNDYNEVDVVDDELHHADYLTRTYNATDIVPHPHMCYSTSAGRSICEVYTKYSKPIDLNVNLFPSLEAEGENESESLCRYKIGSDFRCRITEDIERNLTKTDISCHPIVKCDIYQPYNSSKSILRVSECGYNNISFWLYLIIRSIADIFPATAVALLGAAVVIATRETSTGRGDVGKQFAAGALGFAIFAPIVSSINQPLVALIMFAVMMVLGALIMICDYKMPLSPPEWWWHTRCGLVALPMSSIKKYSMETGALTLVLILLGIFWSAIDSYLPWRIAALSGDPLIIGLSITVGALPAVIYLIFAEKFVDYCGHTNLLITAFALYIIQYTALTSTTDPWLLLLWEACEIFTLHLMWITAVLYLRHLVPRKFTVSGQALPVIAHFCIGRFLGALIGGFAYSGDAVQFVEVHKWLAVCAAIIAILYFLSYHFYLKPKCAAPTMPPPRPTPSIVQSMNGNGSYAPLRVYHNGRAKKGQFRY